MPETTSGIAELIAHLKQDGIDAGEAERARILKAARDEAEAILAQAHKRASQIVDDARAAADRQRAQLTSELKMAARDFMLSFQERLRRQVALPLVEARLQSALSDPDFLKGCLRELCARYAEQGVRGLDVVVGAELKGNLEGAFLKELEAAMKGGKVALVGEDGLVGFRLVPEGETFVWDFSLDAMARELAQLVDPALRSCFDLGGGAPSSTARAHASA